LFLFEIAELEQLSDEQVEASKESVRRKKKSKRGRRLIPGPLSTETIEYMLAEEDRLCSIDGQPLQCIRREESKQFD